MQTENSTNVQFGRTLVRLMRESGLNNTALAERIGVTPTAVGNYVEGRIPKAIELLRIAEVFAVTMEALLGAGGSPEEQEARRRVAVATARARAEEKHGLSPKAIAAKLRALADQLDPPGAQSQSQRQ